MSDDVGLDELEIMERHPPLELRRAEVVNVEHPARTIEIIAVPYDVETPVRVDGRWCVESIAPSAFDGVERRASRVKVNRDHDVSRTCGRALALHPHDKRGLVAELRISHTTLGDETLELAADGVLDASIGYAPMRNGEEWMEQRSRRRVTRAYLGHIALLPDPAYEGANVLDVRNAASPLSPALTQMAAYAEMLGNTASPASVCSATPRLDAVMASLAAVGYSRRPK